MGPINVAPARSRRALVSPLRAGAAAAAPSDGMPVATIAGLIPLLPLPVPRVNDSAGPPAPEPPRLRLMALPFPPAPAPAMGVAGPQAALGTPAELTPAADNGSRCWRLASRAAMRSSTAVADWVSGSIAAWLSTRAKRSSRCAVAAPLARADAGDACGADGAARSLGSIIVI